MSIAAIIAVPWLRNGTCTVVQEETGGDYPRRHATTYHTSPGVPGKKWVIRKSPLAPFYPPLARGRPATSVDSPSAAVRAAARGLLYGQGQMAVAQVDLRLVSAVARPPYRPLLGSY